jgi:hypothetical protein
MILTYYSDMSAAWYVSEQVKHKVSQLNGIPADNFFTKSNLEVEAMLRRAVQPLDALQFVEILQSLVKITLPKDVRNSNVDYNTLYTSFLVYTSQFRLVVKFLTYEQEAFALPPLEKKNHGLIHYYLLGLPRNFGETYYNMMIKAKELEKCHTFEKFASIFENYVKTYGYDPYITTKPVESQGHFKDF